MKKIPYILLFLTVMFTLTSYTTVLKGDKKLETVDYSGFQTDTAQTAKDSTQVRKVSIQASKDTSVAYTDTLDEVSIKAEKGLRVVDVINKSLNKDLTQPRQKSVSDIIGEKATDYIMNPTAWRERRKEKNLKKAKENLKKLDAAKTYENELTEAINRQLREDSIAAAKKNGMKK